MPARSRWSYFSALLASALLVWGPAEALAQTTAEVVRVTETSGWNRPSPDPTGIAYMRSTGKLIVSDSEVEETDLWEGSNVWFTRLNAHPTGPWSTVRYSTEPACVAVRGRRMLFICDDDRDLIFRWRRGPDRRWGTKDDRVRSFHTRAFGSSDPEGLAIAPDALFVVDGADTEVYRITPGPNGRFDGVPPEGDDHVSSFDTSELGLQDPEGAVFDPATGDLYLVSRRDHVIIRATVSGELVETFDISGSGIRSPSDITLAPASDGSGGINAYVTDRGTDNNMDPDENDGRIFEFALG